MVWSRKPGHCLGHLVVHLYPVEHHFVSHKCIYTAIPRKPRTFPCKEIMASAPKSSLVPLLAPLPFSLAHMSVYHSVHTFYSHAYLISVLYTDAHMVACLIFLHARTLNRLIHPHCKPLAGFVTSAFSNPDPLARGAAMLCPSDSACMWQDHGLFV